MKQMKSKAKQLTAIGWREMLALPDLGVEQIKAKIDTGARTSALHAFNCQEFQQDGKIMMRFEIHPWQRNHKHSILAEAELLEYRKVTNSGGQSQIRPVILTTI